MQPAESKYKIPLYALYGQIGQAAPPEFLYLEPIGATNVIHHWNIRPHRHHDLHQLVWASQGHGTVLLDAQALTLRAPTLINIPQTVVHGFQWAPGTDGLVLTLSEGLLRDILQTSRDTEAADTMQRAGAVSEATGPAGLSQAARLFESLADEYVHRRRGRATMLAGMTGVILAELIRLRDPLTPARGELAAVEPKAASQRFRDLVEQHFREQWTVTEYAEHLATTERSLRRRCIADLGMSPLQVIHRRLLAEAQREIVYTAQTMTEIAYQLGFSDPNYFTRFFVRNTGGSTPTEFRERHRSMVASEHSPG